MSYDDWIAEFLKGAAERAAAKERDEIRPPGIWRMVNREMRELIPGKLGYAEAVNKLQEMIESGQTEWAHPLDSDDEPDLPF
jgi:hypothetical protein